MTTLLTGREYTLTPHTEPGWRFTADDFAVRFKRRWPHARVGHSFFMVPELDDGRLRLVWKHHVRPLLEEQWPGQPARLAAYDLDGLLDGAGRRPGDRRREAAGVPG